MTIQPPNIDELLPLLCRAKDEDLGAGDITSAATIPADAVANAAFVAKEPGVVAGMAILPALANLYDPTIQMETLVYDGQLVCPSMHIANVRGPARPMLAFERVALNFLQQLSGVATVTRAFVDAVAGTAAVILDTRKTTPGHRLIEKYAVRCGGGQNHRVGLFDAVLVKDNHVALAAQSAAGERSLADLARRLRRQYPQTLIEIEVDTLSQLADLLTAAEQVDVILLDNMPADELRQAVAMRNTAGARPLLEASGGVNLNTVRAIAKTGVERISVGALTHSPCALDISLDMELTL